MSYSCEFCNYITTDISHYKRHLKTKKHLLKSGTVSNNNNDLLEKTDNSPSSPFLAQPFLVKKDYRLEKDGKKMINSGKKMVYVCPHCKKVYKHQSGLSRHTNSSCKVIAYKKDDQISMLEKKLIEQKIEFLEKTIQDVTERNKETKQENKELKMFIGSGKIGPTYSISIKGYARENFPDAPPLIALKEYRLLKADSKSELAEVLVYHYNHKNLHEYLGDFIVSNYKKEDPKTQSLWNSDTSRLTYIIKQLVTNNESIWNQDPKGVKTRECIIAPLLKHIDNCIVDYILKVGKKLDAMENVMGSTFERLNTNRLICSKIRDYIDDDLGDDIIKYIAAHFYTTAILLDNKKPKNEDKLIANDNHESYDEDDVYLIDRGDNHGSIGKKKIIDHH